ncbi:DUF6505 family protein [Candidatus Phyllobacterium onerii]|uniref:DUF6505 family protein n=1 Tax=Candidatus Phyllobacterium onerii TaxID=3020828 RepID=UPI00232DB7EC|nr:DUF6505 family protein [Phyllobacterium sp. IY22]
MKLLRTVQFDASDNFVFERPAEPGEWAVSGAFAFWGMDVRALVGKQRAAFRAGFLGVNSLGRSTLAQIVNASDDDLFLAIDALAERLLSDFHAPDIQTARRAAEDEINFAASLCDHPAGLIVAVTRSFENETIREAFRTLRPGTRTHSFAFNFVEVVGEDAAEEQVDLTTLGGVAAR